MNRAWVHTFRMRSKYGDQIQDCVNRSVVYRSPMFMVGSGDPQIMVTKTDSVSEAFKHQGRVCILNFASYLNPGGGFLDGMYAQEEALCHESFLFNVLGSFHEFYKWNRKHQDGGRWTNAAIYTPDVLFLRDGMEKKCDVLTCAAPRGYSDCLEDRIRFIAQIVDGHEPDVLILGAFGCGVFGQDPYEVAKCFKSAFRRSAVPLIVYAVPGGENYEAFAKTFRPEE